MAYSNNDLNTSGFTIYWRIESFECEPDDDFSVLSQRFKIQSLNSNWQIEVKRMANGFLGAYLFKETNPLSFFLHYSLSVLTGSGWVTIIDNGRYRFKAGGEGHGADIVDLNTLKREEWLYLPNGSLTISFRLWNDRIKNESSQRLMISRLIDGDFLRHRPIQTFSTLKPSDLFSFPLSYDFQSTIVSNADLQKSNGIKIPSRADANGRNLVGNAARSIDTETKEVKNQHTQTDTNTSARDIQDNGEPSMKLQEAKEVKTQETQTETNFKDLDNLRKLFKEKEFSFVTLQTPTKEFSVHKAVLCTKSPVFNAMFERKMKESGDNVVDIDDIDDQTMTLLVKYLHFEPMDDLKWEAALSLYYPADKYQIGALKEHCVAVLKKQLSVENICDILRLADLHQDSDLMNFAQEYFCKNSKIILPSPQWIEMLGQTELVAKLLCKLAATMH